jgi:HAD superfamily hydrolase (TIGR01490 family)
MTRGSSGRLALFDLDRTVIDCNSGRLWVMAEWREGRIQLRDVAWATWWLGRYSLGHDGGLEQAMGAAVQRLAGIAERELEERVEAWFTREVRHRMRPGAAEVLARHRDAGDRLVLATSGTTYAARAAAEAFGFDGYVATRLEVAEGALTGRIEVSCVGSSKATAVAAWAGAEGLEVGSAAFYTDSATDLQLLERVAEPVVVHPDRTLRRIAAERGWRVEWW